MSSLPPLERRPGPTARVRVHEYASGGWRHHEDRVASEEPLEIRIAAPGETAERFAVTMRTPGHDFELAAGLLHAEGLTAVRSVAYCTDVDLDPAQEFNVVTVQLAEPAARRRTPPGAPVTAASSACGVCGSDSIDDVLSLIDVRRATSPLLVAADVILALPDRLRAHQQHFERTGGLHAAGLFTESGEAIVVREDIGRHNAVDKVIGSRVLAQATTQVPALCVSGRLGFEIVQKAAAAGIGLVVGVGAPSSLAVRLAESAGVSLVGFTRGDRFVVYAGADRIVESPQR